MKPSDFLVLVREELDSHGWCQHTFQNKAGAVSLDGAIKLANRHIQLHVISRGRKLSQEIWDQFNEANSAATKAVEALTEVAKKTGAETIVVLNDVRSKSKSDALKHLDQAIKSLKAENA